jgi:hypothetical protein
MPTTGARVVVVVTVTVVVSVVVAVLVVCLADVCVLGVLNRFVVDVSLVGR